MTAAELLVRLALAAAAACVLVPLLVVARAPLRRWLGAQAAYTAWVLVPLAVAACFMPLHAMPAQAASATGAGPAVATLQGVVTLAASASSGTRWHGLLLALWLAGVAAAATRAFQRQRALVSRLGPLDHVVREVYRTRRTDTGPLLLGLMAPRIVVPADFAQRYTPAEQALILRHERTHWRRGDMHANFVAAALQAGLWFVPFLSLGVRAFRADQELACDAAVMAAAPGQARAYAQALLKTQTTAFSLPVGCTLQAHPIKERIMHLSRRPPRRLVRTACTLALAACTAAIACAAWGVTAEPASGSGGITFRPGAAPGAGQPATADANYRIEIEVKQARDATAAYQRQAAVMRGLPAFDIADLRDADGHACAAHGTIRQPQPGQVEVRMDITCAGQVTQRPVILTRLGEAATVMVGTTQRGPGGKVDIQRGFHLRFTVQAA